MIILPGIFYFQSLSQIHAVSFFQIFHAYTICVRKKKTLTVWIFFCPDIGKKSIFL